MIFFKKWENIYDWFVTKINVLLFSRIGSEKEMFSNLYPMYFCKEINRI